MILEYENFSAIYPKNEDYTPYRLNLSVKSGEAVLLCGESGCGKTTAALCAMRMLQKRFVVEGTLSIDGKNIFEYTEKEYRRIRGARLAYVMQDSRAALNPVRSIGSLAAEFGKAKCGLAEQDAIEKFCDTAQKMGIWDIRHMLGDTPLMLSGGECKRAAIAMALLAEPEILLLDEPSAALDEASEHLLCCLLSDLKRSGTGILVVTHKTEQLSKIADRRVEVQFGASSRE